MKHEKTWLLLEIDPTWTPYKPVFQCSTKGILGADWRIVEMPFSYYGNRKITVFNAQLSIGVHPVSTDVYTSLRGTCVFFLIMNSVCVCMYIYIYIYICIYIYSDIAYRRFNNNICYSSYPNSTEVVIATWLFGNLTERLRGLTGITDHYYLSSNLDVGIYEGCFIFDFASLPLEVDRPI